MSKHITSLQNQLVKDAVSLHLKKYRDKFGLFLVEGEEPCKQAIENGWVCEVLLTHENRTELDNDKVVFVTREILEKVSKKDNPQDMIGLFEQRVQKAPAKASFTLALEEIRDPGNLGTIIRTAHAVNVKQIILVGQCCDPFNPEVIRASMGSFSAIELSAMTQEELLDWQKQNNLGLIGTDVTDAKDYRETNFSDVILVMGNEQKGLSPALKAQCTARVHIPMPGGTESLNLAMATGLLLYEQYRLQR